MLFVRLHCGGVILQVAGRLTLRGTRAAAATGRMEGRARNQTHGDLTKHTHTHHKAENSRHRWFRPPVCVCVCAGRYRVALHRGSQVFNSIIKHHSCSVSETDGDGVGVE